MNIIIPLLLIVSLLQGCSESADNANIATELEGNWEGLCNSGLGSFDVTTSIKTIINYSGNTTSATINTYADSNCTTLSSSLPIQETQLVNPETLAVTFSIGETFTTSNGVTAKELNNYNANNILVPDIYLLQNNNTKLVFGLKCQQPNTGPQLVCTTERPTELDYTNYFTKQN